MSEYKRVTVEPIEYDEDGDITINVCADVANDDWISAASPGSTSAIGTCQGVICLKHPLDLLGNDAEGRAVWKRQRPEQIRARLSVG